MSETKQNQTQEPVTELDGIWDLLSSQNSRLISNLCELEKIGHKIKNTNFPTESANKQEVASEPDGTIQHIQAQLEYYKSHNSFLESLVIKFSNLL